MCQISKKYKRAAEWLNTTAVITRPFAELKHEAQLVCGYGIRRADFTHLLACHAGVGPFDHFYCGYDYPTVVDVAYRFYEKHKGRLLDGTLHLDDYYRQLAGCISDEVGFELEVDFPFLGLEPGERRKYRMSTDAYMCPWCGQMRPLKEYSCSKCGGPRNVRSC